MKKGTIYVLMLVAVLAAVSFMLAACSGGSTTTTTPPSQPPAQQPTQINNATQGSQAASSGVQGGSMASGSTQVGSNLGQMGLSSIVASPKFKAPRSLVSKNPIVAKMVNHTDKFLKSKTFKSVKATIQKAVSKKATFIIPVGETNPCVDGGSYIINGSMSYDDVTFESTIDNLAFIYDQCKDTGYIYNGTYSMSGSFSEDLITGEVTFNTSMSYSNFTMKQFDYNAGTGSYGALLNESTFNLTMQYNGSYSMTISGSDITDVSTFFTKMDGTDKFKDYVGLSSYTITFTNFSNDMNATDIYLASGAYNGTGVIKSNGSFSETWKEGITDYSMSGNYTNFQINYKMFWDYSLITPVDYDLTSISGTFAISFIPKSCFDGSFTFVTITPIKYDWTLGYTTQGQLIINSNTTITYNNNGSITVTTDSSTTNYANEYELSQLCDIATMDEEPPASEGTGGGSVTSATSMTVTSVSSGIDLNCYTDIHVNYYNTTAPTSTTPGTWYVDWHIGGPGSGMCNAPDNVSFEEAMDIDGGGVCDVGLDINGSDTDASSGGLEHFVATQMPVGYYVISMNNWSCATDVTNEVSVQIGNKVFGPYPCTYTTFDQEGSYDGFYYYGAWCKVADVRANADGTIDVLAPITDVNSPNYLDSWHDVNFGMLSPKKKSPGFSGSKRR